MTEPAEIPGAPKMPAEKEEIGHPAVDAAVARLGEVASLSPGEQVAAYEEAHRTLQETLGTIEER
jgi:hypothetical protein